MEGEQMEKTVDDKKENLESSSLGMLPLLFQM